MTTARHNVSISQLPAVARFELVGHRTEITAVLRAANLPVPLAAKAVARSGDFSVASVGPRRWLISASLDSARDIHKQISEALARNSSALLADTTGSTVTFLLQGPGIVEVLAQGIAHDLSAGSFPAESILATEGWGVALLLEQDAGEIRLTVDTTLAAYVRNCLCTAAGQNADTLPGVMRTPPPPIAVSR
jgi:heterotetrameric sarcosine oxidase gamma subunit